MNFAKTSLRPGTARTERRGLLEQGSLLVGSDVDRGARRRRPAFISRMAFPEADGRYAQLVAGSACSMPAIVGRHTKMTSR